MGKSDRTGKAAEQGKRQNRESGRTGKAAEQGKWQNREGGRDFVRKWFAAQRQQTKIMIWYAVFAFLPMILITIYMYVYVRQAMIGNLEDDLDNQIDRIEWELDDTIGDYYTISNLIYTDETLWSYLMTDYSEKGYEDLYLYVDGFFSNIRTMYPEISGISIYSTNDTLPQDNYYFFYLSESDLVEKSREFQQTGKVLYLTREGSEICMTRFLNRYETGVYRNFLEIRIEQSELIRILESGDEELSVLLIDEDDNILFSNREDMEGRGRDELDLNNQVIRERETAYCGQLLLYVDTGIYDRQLRQLSLRVLLIFVGTAVLAFLAIMQYSFNFQKRVEKVMKGAGMISYGNFAYKITDAGKDEIGMIAESVNTLGDQIQQTIEESYRKELDRKISELNQLQEQINPHFLYNALSCISSMALNHQDPQTSQAVCYLADFYRISLNKGNQELTIREELRLLESYMKIQNIRFGNEIMLEYELDESLLDHKVMKLTLQPIVENAIQHGRTDDSENFRILIRLFCLQEKTVLEVIDDGQGIPPEQLMELQENMDKAMGGYGLRNVNKRIRLQYGDKYGISMESEVGFGTKVRVELPGGQSCGSGLQNHKES